MHLPELKDGVEEIVYGLGAGVLAIKDPPLFSARFARGKPRSLSRAGSLRS